MPEFLTLKPPLEALETLLQDLVLSPISEMILATESLGRVLAAHVKAPHPMPSFRRSTASVQ
jgi:molybdopterin biosynthesis enzyme